MTIYGGIYPKHFTGATSSVAGEEGLVPAPDAGSEDYFLRGDGTWAPAIAPGGGVVGPGSVVDNTIVRYDGTTGSLIQDSAITLSDTGAFEGVLSINNTSGNLSLTTTTSGNLDVTSAGTLTLNSAGDSSLSAANFDLTVTGTTTIGSTGAITIDSAAGITATATSSNLSLNTATSGDIELVSAGNLSTSSAGTTSITSTGALTLTGSAGITATTDSSNLALSTTTSGSIGLTSVAAINLNATTNLVATGTNISATANNGGISLATTTTGDIDISSVNNITLTSSSTAINADSAGITTTEDIALAAATSVNMNAGSDITLTAVGSVIIGGLVYPSTDGTGGQFLTTNGSGTLSFADAYTVPIPVTDGGTGAQTLTQNGILYGNGTNPIGALAELSDGQLIIGSTGNAPVPSTLTAGPGINITNAAGSITIDASGVAPWTEVTGTSQAMAINTGYTANNAGLVTLTLPATAAIGSRIKVTGVGAGGWKIAQNAGQTIYFGNTTSTTGATGSIASTHRRDSVELVCVVANTDWNVVSSIGVITIT